LLLLPKNENGGVNLH